MCLRRKAANSSYSARSAADKARAGKAEDEEKIAEYVKMCEANRAFHSVYYPLTYQRDQAKADDGSKEWRAMDEARRKHDAIQLKIQSRLS